LKITTAADFNGILHCEISEFILQDMRPP